MKSPVTLHAMIAALASPAVLFWALPWMMVILTLGTVMQPSMGLYDAVHTFLMSWVVWLWIIPLPIGGMTVMTLITINLCAKYLFKSEWHWRKTGIHLTHAGVLCLMVGGLFTAMTMREGYMVIPETRTTAQVYAFEKGQINITPPQKPGDTMSWGTPMETLPFTLTLNDFVRADYAGTNTPKSYHSDVTIEKDGRQWPTRIAMNDPLRFDGYTIYQSSFLDVGEHQATILQVTRNNGRLFPYIATFMIAAGLIVHLLLMKRGKSS